MRVGIELEPLNANMAVEELTLRPTMTLSREGGGGGNVVSVNGKTGIVVLDANDVGALPDNTTLAQLPDDATHRTVSDAEKNLWNEKADMEDIPVSLSELLSDSTHRTVTDAEKSAWDGKADAGDIPTKTSELTNDSGFLTAHQSLAEYRKASAQDTIDAGFVKKTDNVNQTIQANSAVALNIKNGISGQHKAYLGFGTNADGGIGYIGINGGKPVHLAADGVTEKVLQSENISDAGGYFTTDTVEAALQEIGAELSGVNTLLGSGVLS